MEPVVLSVVIACLDAEGTLGAQLEALASQSCPVPWELLVCDNGSRDGSLALAESFRARIPGLRIVDASARRGAGPARNLGVELARGAWVAFCDADDVVAGDWLARMCAALQQHRFVAGRFEKHRLNGRRVLRSRPLQQDDALQSSDLGPGLPHAGGGNLGMQRADFLLVGGFDPAVRWLEDTDLSWRAQLAGIPLVFAGDVVVHVRLRSTFRAMFTQGRQYGFAQAQLEQRYGSPTKPRPSESRPSESRPGAGIGPGPLDGCGPSIAEPLASRLRRWAAWWVDHVIGGRLFWRIGWVVGHRTPLEPVAADPGQAARPVPARAVPGRR